MRYYKNDRRDPGDRNGKRDKRNERVFMKNNKE